MCDAVATVRPDCPSVPDDAKWCQMYETELLCGKEGELRKIAHAVHHKCAAISGCPCEVNDWFCADQAYAEKRGEKEAKLQKHLIDQIQVTNYFGRISERAYPCDDNFCNCLCSPSASVRKLTALAHFQIMCIKPMVPSLLVSSCRS